MSNAALNDVWRAIQGLTPTDRQQLRDWLDRMEGQPQPAAERGNAERLVEQMLLARGAISVPTGPVDLEAFRNWEPVEVEGRPVSETLIEDRR